MNMRFVRSLLVLGLVVLPFNTLALAPLQSIDITVTAPAEKAQLTIGNTYTISWSAPAYTGNLNILLFGTSYDGSNFDYHGGYVAKNVPNTGSYTWNTSLPLSSYSSSINTTIVNGNMYLLELSSDDQVAIGDSPGYFTLTMPGVVWPTVDAKVNGQDKPSAVPYNSQFTFSWTSQNATSCQATGDELGLVDGTGSWADQTNLPVSGSKMLYAKDVNYNYYNPLFVGVMCRNSANLSDSDEITLDLTGVPQPTPTPMPAPSPTPTPAPALVYPFTSPKAGDKIKFGETTAITWQTAGFSPYVNLAVYSTALPYSYIAKNIPNSGSYSWKTSNQLVDTWAGMPTVIKPGGEYVLYIESLQDDLNIGATAGNFTITDAKGQVVNNKPKGNLETISQQGIISGWAFDPDHLYKSISVHTYIDSPAGKGKTPIVTATDYYRTDVNDVYKQEGSHGFNIQIPAKYLDGQQHTAYVYAIDGTDATGAHNVMIEHSPMKFKLDSAIQKPAAVIDGQLYNDKGTIYVIENHKKRGLASMDVFNGLGYSWSNVIRGDLSDVPAGVAIGDKAARHPRGASVNLNGTIYFIGTDVKYAFPSAEVFLAWGAKFEEVVKGNAADAAMQNGPIVTMPVPIAVDSGVLNRDAIRVSDVRQIMTALELFYNDNQRYPTSTAGQPSANDGSQSYTFNSYLSNYPVAPSPADGNCVYSGYTYTYLTPSTYSLAFCLGSSTGGLTAGPHTASQAGVQ